MNKKIQFVALFIILVLNLYSDPPNWEVIPGTQYSMLLRAHIIHNNELFEGEDNNIAAAFASIGEEEECRSVGVWIDAHPPYYEEGFWQFGIVSNQTEGEVISFKIYNEEADSIYNCIQIIIFEDDTTIGTPVDPFILSTGSGSIHGTVDIVGMGDIEKVEITAASETTNPTWNEIGFWEYNLELIPGIYDITATMLGFQDSTISNVEVFLNQVTEDINFFIYLETSPLLSLPSDVFSLIDSYIDIPLSINIPEDVGLEGINVIITFNHNIITATDATLVGGILEEEDYNLGVNLDNEGEIILEIYANNELYYGSGIISYLEFYVNPFAVVGDTTELIFTQSEINEYYVTTNSCTFTVLECVYEISGCVNYFFQELAVPFVNLNLEDDYNFEEITDETGLFIISNIITGNYILTPSKYNDLDGLSGTDASRVFRHSIGLYDFTCHEMIAADVTLGGSISNTDASRIAQHAAGIIDNLNDNNTHWVFIPEPILNCDDWPPIEYETTRVYNPLDTNYTDENFIGIRLGDVTGNWEPESTDNLFINHQKIKLSRDDPSAILPNINAAPEESISIPLTINDLEDLEGLDIAITFNENVIIASDATLENGILEDESYGLEVNTNVNGQITLIFYANSNLFSGSGVVAYLEFFVIGDEGNISPLILTQFDVNETSYLENVTNGSVYITSSNIDDSTIIPHKTYLEQNFPNPFNPANAGSGRSPSTTISYSISEDGDVKLEIFNIKGQLIKTLINEYQKAGKHRVIWNPKNLCSGIYLYKLNTGKYSEIKKALLLK